MFSKITYQEALNKCTFEKINLRIFDDYCKDTYVNTFLRYYEGDQTFENICLDLEHYEPNEVALIIDGDLKVNNVFNFDIFGAVHLIILGNFYAKNIAVGGQDLHITGNLNVEESFIGRYNHGTTHVSGDVACPIILIDDYSFTLNGNLVGKVFGNEGIYILKSGENNFLWDGDWNNVQKQFQNTIFKDDTINFKEVVRTLKNGNSLFLQS